MKRIIAYIAIALVALTASIPAAAQFRYGPTVGISLTNLHYKQDLFQVDKSVGFSAGIAAEFMFPGIGFGIDLGLGYEKRGAKLHMGDRPMWADMGIGTEQMDLHSIVLPIHLRFKYTRLGGIEDKIAPLVYAGPSFGFIAGHSKMGNAYDYAAADLGMDFGLGAEICKRWQVSAQYTLGLTYALKAKILTNFSARNRIWSVRCAYFF